ncbi:unnamed protein product [Polarella glacialis]|uniref:Uncharacterized protein n=1 Tax=Polarella glacialis TaxID=89957 RepID=A0A813JEQ2_POLGL|nr:unnamed protein product [Polarella glacialis]
MNHASQLLDPITPDDDAVTLRTQTSGKGGPASPVKKKDNKWHEAAGISDEQPLNASDFKEQVGKQCTLILASLGKLYTDAELKRFVEPDAPEHIEWESDDSMDDLPSGPSQNAPLQASERRRKLPGLLGVLGSGRGRIDELLERVNAEKRERELTGLNHWFEEQVPEALKAIDFLDDLERMRLKEETGAKASQAVVEQLEKDICSQARVVQGFAINMRKVAGSGGADVIQHLKDDKERARQLLITNQQAVDAYTRDLEETLAMVKRLETQIYAGSDVQIVSRKAEQAYQELQKDLEKRLESITRLSAESEEKTEENADLTQVAEKLKVAAAAGKFWEPMQEHLEQIVKDTREILSTKKQKGIRSKPSVAKARAAEQVDLLAISGFNKQTRELESQIEASEQMFIVVSDGAAFDYGEENDDQPEGDASSGDTGGGPNKESTAEMTSARSDKSGTNDDAADEASMHSELLETINLLRSFRSQTEKVQRSMEGMEALIESCQVARAASRQIIQRAARGLLAESMDDQPDLSRSREMLPRLWQRHFESSWEEAQEVPELFAHLMFTDLSSSEALTLQEPLIPDDLGSRVESTWMSLVNTEEKLGLLTGGPDLEEQARRPRETPRASLEGFWQTEDAEAVERSELARAEQQRFLAESLQLAQEFAVEPERRLQEVKKFASGVIQLVRRKSSRLPTLTAGEIYGQIDDDTNE